MMKLWTMPRHIRTDTTMLKPKFIYLGSGLILALLLAGVYRFGPESELSLLSRLHYNTLFILTPCMGEKRTYDDGSVKFHYIKPPRFFSNTAPIFIDPLHHSGLNPFRDASEVIDMNLSFHYAYKFRPARPSDSAPGIGTREIQFRNGKGVVKIEAPSATKYGPEFVYFTKSSYTYRIPLPVYAERMTDKTWLSAALHHAGILDALLPGVFIEFPPPRGFFTWFFTPCADKQWHCSSNAILNSLEMQDQVNHKP